MRRSLSQQKEVKARLYQQFLSLVRENQGLCLSVFEVLQPHLYRYLEAETVLCPFKMELLFESAAATVELSEPFASLLLACLHCLIVHADSARSGGTRMDPRMIEFRRRIDSVLERLVKCALEDFGLDKSGDFSGSSVVGFTNAWKASTLLRVHEAFIEYLYYTEGLTVDSSEVILKVFHLGDDLRWALRKGAGKKKVEPLPSVMTLLCVAHLADALFGDPTASKQQAKDILSEDDGMVKFVVQLALHNVQMVITSVVCLICLLLSHIIFLRLFFPLLPPADEGK